MSRARPQVVAVRAALAEARKLIANALAGLDRLQGTVRAELAEGGPTPLEDLPAPSAHRRAHRPGPPPRIDTDPELRAFIRARIDRMTLTALAEEVAKALPPERRADKSALPAWWQKSRPGR